MKFLVSSAVLALTIALLPALGYTQEKSASFQGKLSPFAPLSASSEKKDKADFPLATSKFAAPIFTDANDYPVVRIAADALGGDIEQVTGAKPNVGTGTPAGAAAVFVGTLGKSRLIDVLIARKKIDVSRIKGKWESFIIATVDNPVPGVAQGLVIAGSDRRGTAFGVFSVSESIGVSPWVWWADVKPTHRDSLVISRVAFNSNVPSVKYRGIFINDEDFGLQPWAAKTFEPENKDIGPKTYAKVCELLLRLKANYLWPAMHPSTRAFNSFPENRVVADRYGIVMGASHAEPMLRNNVGEWDHKTMGDYNYVTNRDKVLSYWDQRVAENGKYENNYTIGMRGIHDSPMEGDGTTAEKVARLEDIFTQQRAILAKHVNPDPSRVPQVFVPYKEVLGLYQNGLKVPDDVTLMWVDDNHGYIRQLSDATEQKRSGGSGVYYHFSYWGAPQDYLWLGSTSPVLTAYEMGKAYAYGANRVWVFNVGDIKPIEKEMEFGLRLAYDVNRYPADKALDYLTDWATENFGAAKAPEIAAVLKEYYRLARQVKPEHIDRVSFTPIERQQRLSAYAAISNRAQKMYDGLPVDQKDAFYQLVAYPVQAAALMDQKQNYSVSGIPEAALNAYNGIQALTARYNNVISGGKWKNMMDDSPRNTSVFDKPDPAKIGAAAQEGSPVIGIAPNMAQLSGEMKLIGGNLTPSAEGQLIDPNPNTAKFTFTSTQDQKTTLYFLAQCPDDKHDSWFVSVNGQKVTVNDQVTGAPFKWLRIMDADLKAGQNDLVITQRESGALIQKIAFLKPGTYPPVAAPDAIIPAAKYTAAKNGGISRWEKIEGLGTERDAMTLTPYQTAGIADADVAKAPSLSYHFTGTTPGSSIEVRFLPTHQVNATVGLRYAVSVDNGPVQIRSLEALEYSGTWGRNVLDGYASDTTSHALSPDATHTVTLTLLSPGIVVSQLRVFLDKTAPTAVPYVAPVSLSAKADFHLYLLMGQSNMVGRDARAMISTQNPRILAMNGAGQWVVAKNPLHEDGKIAPGVGPGLSFAQEMIKTQPKGSIGLIPCAVGGSPLSRWVKGADLYQNALARAQAASKDGEIDGVLWHQGEAETDNKVNADSYETRLTQMFKDLRSDLGQPNLPVVVGQLGEFLTVQKYPYVQTVRTAIKHMPADLPKVGYADSNGLMDRGDSLHFNAQSQQEFGKRYAAVMQELEK